MNEYLLRYAYALCGKKEELFFNYHTLKYHNCQHFFRCL